MISSIEIRGYRGFEEFTMGELGRVNLLVGKNNSGKTSVLEAIYLLVSRGDPAALWSVLWRRGERLERASETLEFDVSHLFTGHDIGIGSKFTFLARNQSPERNISFKVVELSEPSHPSPSRESVPARVAALPSRLGLQLAGTPTPVIASLPLTRNGSLTSASLEVPRRVRGRARPADDELAAQFITTESINGYELVSLWNSVALTQSEERVMEALRFIEPNIERIAAQALGPPYYSREIRGGFIAKMANAVRPVPIGSLGDGMWRMLAMAIAIAQCKDGVLLIDEIDTGLHHTVMADMWRLMFRAARELNVQVFATTHSFDCVHSLAVVCMSNEWLYDKITLQRVERGKRVSVPYTEEEIVTAAREQIEVR